MRKPLALAVLATAAALAAGCGGDDDDKLSKGEFIAQADRACVERIRPTTPPKDANQAAEQTAEQAKVREELQNDIKQLDAPDEVKADLDKFLASSQRMIDQLKKMSSLARQDNRKEFSEADQDLNRFALEREKVADKIGFKKCGQPFTPEEQKQTDE